MEISVESTVMFAKRVKRSTKTDSDGMIRAYLKLKYQFDNMSLDWVFKI